MGCDCKCQFTMFLRIGIENTTAQDSQGATARGECPAMCCGVDAARQPLKHTLIVQPGSRASFDLTANEPGDWAFHCHLLYHMHAGMMQVVTVRPFPEAGDI